MTNLCEYAMESHIFLQLLDFLNCCTVKISNKELRKFLPQKSPNIFGRFNSA